MKVAVVHEMLIKLGWAENVVSDILEIFPDADLFTLIYDEEKVSSVFPKHRIKYVPKITQRIYNLFKKQRFCLPYMARAIESIDLSEYDLVIASSSWFAHGCITKPETCFVVYYHSPARYLWDYTFENRKDLNYKSWLKKPLNIFLSMLFNKLRIWDYLAGQRHDVAIAASKQVQARISKYYRRWSELIYPPVYTEEFTIWEPKLKDRQYYVIASALTEFKKIDLAVKAFNELWLPLIIMWDGAQRQYLESIAKPNIKFAGYCNREQINECYQNARWFILAWREDFGIAPIEAMASGVPVFWLREWGLTETSVDWVTWEFFDKDDVSDFVKKFRRFHDNIEDDKYDRIKIRDHALNFSKENFVENMQNVLNKYLCD